MLERLNKYLARERMNAFSEDKIPFLFILDFEGLKNHVIPLNEIPLCIQYSTPWFRGPLDANADASFIGKLTPKLPSFKKYKIGFDQVLEHIKFGNSFLLNLSMPIELREVPNLRSVFNQSVAKYKLWIENELVVFSPESFVQIKDEVIYSYPMKGTIEANLPNAEKIILEDSKELSEHFTIVDLIRNDLSKVSTKVKVDKFRYIDKIHSNNKDLLQVSSKISGTLRDHYKDCIGDILFELLPAGSISGAPKTKTIEIISEIEGKKRGYYTGVFGVYDGKNLDSGVMIRCIQNDGEKYNYHSGGGITHLSDAKNEYNELLNKVYVPLIRNDSDKEWSHSKPSFPQSSIQ